MFTNRFLLVIGLLSLLLVAMSALEEADQTQQRWVADTARWEAMGEFYANQADAEHNAVPPYIINSATRAYIAWGDALEAITMDSATRSYIAQAKTVACSVDPTSGLDLGSATQSYIAWAKSLETRNSCQ